MLDVVTAVEGSGPVFRCDSILAKAPGADPRVDFREICVIAQAMGAAEAAFRQQPAEPGPHARARPPRAQDGNGRAEHQHRRRVPELIGHRGIDAGRDRARQPGGRPDRQADDEPSPGAGERRPLQPGPDLREKRAGGDQPGGSQEFQDGIEDVQERVPGFARACTFLHLRSFRSF
jgi:hypothetical protein